MHARPARVRSRKPEPERISGDKPASARYRRVLHNPWPLALRRSLGLLVKEQEDLARVEAEVDTLLAVATL